VTDSREVLTGAVVRLHRTGETEPAYRTSSDSDGRYSVRIATGVTYNVYASAPGYGSVATAVGGLTGGETATRFMRLPVRESTIAGTITDTGGLPLQGALLEIPAYGDPATTANAYGDYVFYVDAGLHDMWVRHAGYEPVLHNDVLAVNNEVTELDCELVDVFASLQGTVFDSTTSEPVPGVLLTAVWGGGLSAVTGLDGEFELASLVPGEITLVATKHGFVGEEGSLTLDEHEIRDHDIDLARLTGSIAGTVTESSGGLPIAGVSIRARHDGEVASAAMTVSDGRYVLAGLYPGTAYDIHASRAGLMADSVNPYPGVAPGALDIDFTMSECAGVISGGVFDGVDSEPLGGALIAADNGLGHFGTATTDADGSFTIDGLAEIGAYEVTVSLYGYFDASTPDVVPGGSALNIDMPRNFARLAGALTPQGAGVELGETHVVATNIAFAGHSRTAVPDSEGDYEITELRPGSYVLSVIGGTHVGTPAQTSMAFEEGEFVSGVDFTVERAVIGRIDVEGPDEVEAGSSAVFSGSVFALDERLVNTDLEWWIAPQCAGAVSRASGEVVFTAGYIGEATVSAREPDSGTMGRTSADVYVTVTPEVGASPTDSLGATLTIEPGAVSETRFIYLSHEQLPDVMRNFKDMVVEERAYHFKPSGMPFEPSSLPTLSIPYSVNDETLLRWDHDLMAWAELATEHFCDALETEIASLGKFAAGAPSGPLGVSGVLAEPNPFAPDNGPIVISYDLNSDDARMPFVTVRIYNIAGQFVRELVSNEPQGKGRTTVEWDGLTESAETAGNGRYVVQVTAEDSTGTETALGTVVLVK